MEQEIQATVDKWLVKNTSRGDHGDDIWGAGKSEKGANKLGICLMVKRQLL
jgi:predicted NAD-dependent protein-ADP-ribosyltransferase YbiA (DUF1768 family)